MERSSKAWARRLSLIQVKLVSEPRRADRQPDAAAGFCPAPRGLAV